MIKVLSFFASFFLLACADLAYMQGKSGNIIYQPINIKEDSFLYVVDKYSEGQVGTIEETSVADLISHFIGTPVVNPSTSRANFPKGSIFDKDKANLLVVLESIGSDVVNVLPPLKVLNLKGQQFEITNMFYPEDQISRITSLFTGFAPSVHGVVNRYWNTYQDGKVTAYTDVSTSAQVPNLADVVSNTFGGRSLIISGSANRQSALSLAANKFAAQYSSPNSYALFWNDKTSSYQNLFPNSLDIPVTKSALLDALSTRTFPLRNKGDKVINSKENQQIIVDFAADEVHATFDLNNMADFLFFSEIEILTSLTQTLQQSGLKVLVSDQIPDLFSFSFSTLKALSKDEQKLKAAILLLDSVLSQVINEYQSLYGGKAAVEIAFMGTPAYEEAHDSTSNTAFKTAVYNRIRNSVDRKMFEDSFPVIFVESGKPQTVCQSLVDVTSPSYQLICPEDVVSSDFKRDVQLTVTEVASGVALFQIVLWFSIVLVVALFAAVYALYGMDVGRQLNQFMLPAKSK